MRIALATVSLLLLATFAPASLHHPHVVPASPWVQWTPVEPVEAKGCDFGELRFLEGWQLTSNHPEFGGLSGLAVRGTDVAAVSDTGYAFSFPLKVSGKVALTARAVTQPVSNKKMRDSESLGVFGEQAWIGFEHSNIIRRYRLPEWRMEGAVGPHAMKHWPEKKGAETLLRLVDGRFLIIAEGGGEALLFDRDPVEGGRPILLRYDPPTGFRPTDAAELGDGRILILNRRYSLFDGLDGFTVIMTLATLPRRAHETMRTREVARFARPCLDDNHEALSVTHDNGRDTLWLASDDNFGPLQRTLILKFALESAKRP